MIIVTVGDVGSGKSMTSINQIIRRPYHSFTNFHLYNTLPGAYTRMKISHIMNFETDDKGNRRPESVNYDFWKGEIKKRPFDIYIDELQEVMNSRRGTSKENILIGKWVSQIRKVLAYNEANHLYLTTQRPMSIDVQCRELAHRWVYCEKKQFKDKIPTVMWDRTVKRVPVTVIYQYVFKNDVLQPETLSLETFRKLKSARRYVGFRRLLANPLMKHYNSYEILDFGNEEAL